MYVFTLWDERDIPDRYKDCISKLLVSYPNLVIEPFRCPEGERPDQYSDFVRMRRMSEIYELALYVDADCTPGPDLIPLGDRISFANLRGGVLDIWAIFKPEGHQEVFIDILANWKKSGHIQTYVNDTRDRYNKLSGYPDNKYFNHHHLSRF